MGSNPTGIATIIAIYWIRTCIGMEMIYPWDVYRSKVSRVVYRRMCRHFLEFGGYVDPKLLNHVRGHNSKVEAETLELERGIRNLVEEARSDPEKTKDALMRYIRFSNERIDRGEIASDAVFAYLKPIKLALDMNDVPFIWSRLRRLVHIKTYPKDREYTLDEIKLLVSKAQPHLRVAILFMVSSGIRVGAFDYMRVGDVAPLEIDGKVVCGKLTVYAGEGNDEYVTLISKEAYDEWLLYLRRRGNPPVTAPAITDRAERNGIKAYSVRRALNHLLWSSGLRREKKKRHEVMQAHGFRKFFDNTAKDYLDEEYVERLMGHDMGVREHYDRHLPKLAVEQYLRAMPYLSVGEAYRNEAKHLDEIEKLKKENSEKYVETRLELLESKDNIRKLELRIEKQASVANELEELRKMIENIKNGSR